jgi:AP-4 complex subunit epsilon-1
MWPTALTSSHTTTPALVPYDHASTAFQSLIQAIAECTSREDEWRIVSDECERLRTELAQPHQRDELAEMLVRAIYCEMFGASAPFAIIPAMGLAQHPNPRAKQVGYMACTLLLSPSHELTPLLQNTIHRDLGSP